MDFTLFNKQNLDSCGTAIFKIVGDNEGEDNIFNFMSTKQIIPKQPVNIKPQLYIKGCIIRQPRTINRINTYNCRTQRITSRIEYVLQGAEVYSSHELEAIEDVFHSRTLYLNGHKIQLDTTSIFEPLDENFPNKFRLVVPFYECEKRQSFGCKRNILYGGGKLTFGIPEELDSDTYMTDGGTQLGGYSALLDYYRGLNNTVSVTDIDIDTVETDIKFSHIFDVERNGYVDNSFYAGKVSPSNKVYGLVLSEPDAYNELSRGMNIGYSPDIVIGDITVEYEPDLSIQIGVIEVIYDACTVMPRNEWECNYGDSYITYNEGNKYLNLNIVNYNADFNYSQGSETEIMPSDGYFTFIGITEPITQGSIIGIDINDVPYTGEIVYTIEEGVGVTFDPIPVLNNDEVTVRYNYINGMENQIIAYIDGYCLPDETIALSNADDAQIPVGAQLTIQDNGVIYWSGVPTNVNEDYVSINLSNLKF